MGNNVYSIQRLCKPFVNQFIEDLLIHTYWKWELLYLRLAMEYSDYSVIDNSMYRTWNLGKSLLWLYDSSPCLIEMHEEYSSTYIQMTSNTCKMNTRGCCEFSIIWCKRELPTWIETWKWYVVKSRCLLLCNRLVWVRRNWIRLKEGDKALGNHYSWGNAYIHHI